MSKNTARPLAGSLLCEVGTNLIINMTDLPGGFNRMREGLGFALAEAEV
jgi:hypothetical protein